MAMVRWDPFSEMMTVQRDMNRLFSSLGMPLYTSKGDGERVSWMPTVDVVRKGDDLVVRAELPGVKPEDIDVSVTDDTLTIKGHRREQAEYREGDYLRKESSHGSFERQVMLPQGMRAQDIRADYRDGILEIVVPGAARTVSKETQRIPVRGGGQQTMSGPGVAQQGGQGMQGRQGTQGGPGMQGQQGMQGAAGPQGVPGRNPVEEGMTRQGMPGPGYTEPHGNVGHPAPYPGSSQGYEEPQPGTYGGSQQVRVGRGETDEERRRGY